MSIEQVLSNMLHYGSGERFYRFANADGKTWLMPVHGLRTAMGLYQPSGRNGKLLKRLFPLLHRFRIVRKVIHAESMLCTLHNELRQLLEKIFCTTNLEYAIFCGTPCVHQKITMQISKGKQVLGYSKFTENKAVILLFQQEAQMLKELEQAGIRDIPKALYCGQLDNGVWMFVQSTKKSTQSRVLHHWTKLHEEFLNRLYHCTQQPIEFEKGDFYQRLYELMTHLEWLPKEVEEQQIRIAYNRLLKRWGGKRVLFAAYHADFTPWNMFVEKGRLFVFDWEYAQRSYPLHLDRYHFFTQTAIFERHWGVGQIIEYLHSNDGRWMDKEDYTAYLMDMIARFTIREQGKVEGDIVLSMKLWNDLLAHLNQFAKAKQE
ncbi:MAG: phosphotransferase [Parabacteroides sp.]